LAKTKALVISLKTHVDINIITDVIVIHFTRTQVVEADWSSYIFGSL
jgi:hypothetical protein